MSTSFDPNRELIVVPASIAGPGGSFKLAMAVDTGATQTIVNSAFLSAAGYDPPQWGSGSWLVTASGATYAHRVSVSHLRALGWQRHNFEVLVLSLSPALHVDGFLGLDFLKDHVLTIDLHHGEIEMTAGPSASATP